MDRVRPFANKGLLAAIALGAVYACSGNPEVIQPGGGVGGRSGKSGAGGSSANGGTLSGGTSSGGTIGVTGGTAGKSGSTGGKGGAVGGTGGTSSGGDAGDDGSGAFGGFPDIDFTYDGGLMGQGGACEQVGGKADLVKKPMDIIISIDNSGSMAGEIAAVIDNINVDFASIIEASGIDYRVIMVARYGQLNYAPSPTNYSVCIGPPLGNAACPDPNATAPALVNTARFFHHSTDIGSNNMWCRLLDAYDSPDEIPNQRNGWTDLAPNGFQDWLRPEALKVFIGITDDDPLTSGTQGCANTAFASTLAGAQSFDQTLRTLAPTQFGAYDMNAPDTGRNYRWYSIVGMSAKAAPNATVPYSPTEPIVNTVCTGGNNNSQDDDGVADGEGYQHLSIMTGGLRYSNCLNDDFDAIFNAIAEGVIEGAQASCEYDVPIPQNGIVDFDQTVVAYHPAGNAAQAVNLARVATELDCATEPAFYFNSDNTKIFLCPTTCTTVQADPEAEVAINFGCLGS